jgi:Ca-activated chloride channel family protein
MRIYRQSGRWGTISRMWGRSRLALSPLLLLLPPFALTQNKTQNGEFRISVDAVLVLLDVSVKDTKGGYVSGLSKGDFHVYENGLLQTITVFATADEPVTVGLVMDDSGSMSGKRTELNSAGVAFVEASNPLDQIFVVNFNDRVRSGLPDSVPFSDKVGLLRSALSHDRPEGRTALYDGVVFALRHLETGQRDKKTLVVVSDGGDNISSHNFPELMQLIQESRATIYTVGVYDEDDPDKNPQILRRIANASGGECFLPEQYSAIIPLCQRIAKDIRNRYTIGYVPVRSDQKVGLRKIRVAADARNHGKLIVRTRTGYSLPDRLVTKTNQLEQAK